MRPVQTLLWLPRGGAVLGGVFGVVLGCAANAVGWVPIALAALFTLQRLYHRELPMAVISAWLAVGSMFGLAELIRPDPMEQRIRPALPSRHIAVDELDRRIAWGDDELPSLTVELPSLNPSWREIETALARVGLRLQVEFPDDGSAPRRVHIRASSGECVGQLALDCS